MAQYLISVLTDTGEPGTEEEMLAISAFNEQLMADGHWVFAGGLGAPDTATVIDGRYEEPVFTDGPFLESKEFVAGFWIIEAADAEEARRLASLASKHCNSRIELRPFLAG